jgi:hypothetical protein
MSTPYFADAGTSEKIRWPLDPSATGSRLDIYKTNGTPRPLYSLPGSAVLVEVLMGTATSDKVLTSDVERISSRTWQTYGLPGQRPRQQVIGIDIRNRKWLALKWRHFARAGRSRRIQEALRAIERAVTRYDLDAVTMRWVAQDAAVEDI